MTYKTTPDGPLTVDVFAPDDERARPRPAILFFHGGGWTGGSPEQFYPFGEPLAKRGAVVMNFAYRLLRNDNEAPLAAMQDAQDAVRWTLAQADEMGVDRTRIVIGGESAGAHIALTTLFVALRADAATVFVT
ncbi:MAG: alpha/beta hydrolase, partial [Phycisphaeraceae bacterium]